MKDEKLNQNDFQKETLDFSEMEKIEGGRTGCAIANGKCTGKDSGCGITNGQCKETSTDDESPED